MIQLTSIEALLGCVQSRYADGSRGLALIGGCARSGKSTLAAALSGRLASTGMETPILQLDSWLVSLEARQAVSTVMERYEITAIVDAVSRILNRDSVFPPVYDPVSRRRTAERGPASISLSTGLLIVEGVIALALAPLLQRAAVRVFASIDDDVRVQRMVDFYTRTKGLSEEDARVVIDSREGEEVRFIKATMSNADVVYAGLSHLPGSKLA